VAKPRLLQPSFEVTHQLRDGRVDHLFHPHEASVAVFVREGYPRSMTSEAAPSTDPTDVPMIVSIETMRRLCEPVRPAEPADIRLDLSPYTTTPKNRAARRQEARRGR
jgi:hypothetical protein